MCSRPQIPLSWSSCDLVEKDDTDRWIAAQQVISQGQGRRAWRNTPSRSGALLYIGVLTVLVLALVAVAVVRSWQ